MIRYRIEDEYGDRISSGELTRMIAEQRRMTDDIVAEETSDGCDVTLVVDASDEQYELLASVTSNLSPAQLAVFVAKKFGLRLELRTITQLTQVNAGYVIDDNGFPVRPGMK